MTQEEINRTQKEANKIVHKVERYQSMSQAATYCMCGASLCLVVDMATGRVIEMPLLSSFWTTAFLLLVFIILLWCTDHFRQKLAVLYEALGLAANDVTANISTE